MRSFIDLKGKVFGRLTVLYRDGCSPSYESKWRCLCSCGKEKTIVGASLRNGSTSSCGCFSKEVHLKATTTHGLVNSPVYGIWRNMLNRCRNPNDKRWLSYGGRGITVCAGWKDFTNFHNWAMSSGFSKGLTLERVQVDGNYEPGNCSWIPREEQSCNRTNTVRVLYQGELQPLSKVCQELGLKYGTIMQRIYRGKSPEESIK